MEGIGDLLAATAPETRNPSGTALSQEDFFSIMISELVNQDPLEPMDNQEFLNQLVQMQTLQATSTLSEGIQGLLLGQQISSAGALIGQQVVALAGDETVQGTVDRVLVDNGKVYLGIGENLAAVESVTQVLGVAADDE